MTTKEARYEVRLKDVDSSTTGSFEVDSEPGSHMAGQKSKMVIIKFYSTISKVTILLVFGKISRICRSSQNREQVILLLDHKHYYSTAL